MKREIFKKFIIILGIALFINSAVSCFMISRILFSKMKESMQYTLEILDGSLDYDGNLKEQIQGYEDRITDKGVRFTIITTAGAVCADNTVDNVIGMGNHSDREEFKEALESGSGSSMRYSGTVGIYMFYMAIRSSNGGYLLRVALPFAGMGDYVVMLIPSLLVSLLVSIMISIILTERLSRSIAKPLKEISDKMGTVHNPGEILEFGHYKYDEMNVISETTKHMTQEVNEYVKKLEHERTVRQEFFSNVSHELKTPITSIRGFAELLQNDMVADEAKKQEFLVRILKETNHMTNLINDILMISRLETREAEVTMSKVSMSGVLKDIIEEIAPLADKNEVVISYNSMPVMYYANPQQMRELLANLLTNAVKYNKPQGRVHASIDQVREEIVIEVYDTGIGIPAESIPRVFERFYRVDKGRSRSSGGTGLGLSIVKHIVEYYNGRIEIDSKVNIGTTITVYLPVNQ